MPRYGLLADKDGMQFTQVDARRPFDGPEKGAALVHSSLSRQRMRIAGGTASLKYVLTGCEIYHLGGRRFLLEPGDLLFVRAGTAADVDIASRSATVGMCVYFDDHEGQGIDSPFLRMRAPSAYDGAAMEVHTRVRQGTLTSAGLKNSFETLKTIGLAVTTRLNASCRRLSMAREDARIDLFSRLERARGYILDHVRQPMSLDDLARHAGMSRHHFIRQFRAAYGVSPMRFFSRARLDAACRALSRGPGSIEDVSVDFGYSGQAAFSKAFKKRYGFAPSHILRHGPEKSE